MGKLGAFAAVLLVFATVAALDASARVLLPDSDGTLRDNSSKSVLSRSAQNPDTKSSQTLTSADSSNTTEPKALPQPGSHPNPPPPPGPNAKSTGEVHAGDTGNSVGTQKPVEKNAEASSGSHEPREAGNPPADKGIKEGGKEAENHTDKSMKDRCASPLNKCPKENLTACLGQQPTKSLLVQNTGENSLNVTIKTTQGIILQSITLPRNGFQEVIVTDWNAPDIILNAGEGDCSFHITKSAYNMSLLQQLPVMTPIYGAYFFLFTIVLAAGVWACCKFKKGRIHDPGVPYQQLEMGTHLQSSSTVEDGNTASGWDDGWDDDWDDEEAVGKPSKEHQSNGVSSIGVTSRAPNKDGWDVDWDD